MDNFSADQETKFKTTQNSMRIEVLKSINCSYTNPYKEKGELYYYCECLKSIAPDGVICSSCMQVCHSHNDLQHKSNLSRFRHRRKWVIFCSPAFLK